MNRDNDQAEQIERLYTEMCPILLAYAKNTLKEFTLAEEAVQDTFCIACAKKGKFLQSGNPQGWLMTTLKFVIKNTMRQMTKTGHLADLPVNFEESFLLAAYDEVNIDVLYENLAAQKDFPLFKKVALDRYSMREAAEEFGITVEVCKKRTQRLRAVLRKSFLENEK